MHAKTGIFGDLACVRGTNGFFAFAVVLSLLSGAYGSDFCCL